MDTPAAADQSIKALEDILKILVPPDVVTITDINGTEHTLTTAIPARRQIKVFRMFKEISDSNMLAPALAAARSGGGNFTAASVIDLIITLAADEQVAEALGKIFSSAYPNVCNGTDPLDLLPIEEIVGGVAPLSLRFAQKTGGAMKKIAEATALTA